MIPSKAGALPEKLPPYAAGGAQPPENNGAHVQKSAVDEAVSVLKQKVDVPEIVMDIKNVLKQHQDEYIYFRTDHHWTALGCLLYTSDAADD